MGIIRNCCDGVFSKHSQHKTLKNTKHEKHKTQKNTKHKKRKTRKTQNKTKHSSFTVVNGVNDPE